MLVMVVFFIAFRWIHLSTPLIRLFLLVVCRLMLVMVILVVAFRWMDLVALLISIFLLVLILDLMPTLNFLPVWLALNLLRYRLPPGRPMMFILWMVAMMVVIIPSRT